MEPNLTWELYVSRRLYASKSEYLDAHRLATPSRQRRARLTEEKKVDTEAGMLSGISRKRSMRSRSYWFTEFCNSQCLSHFAAPFIVVRAETSIAESCKVTSMTRGHAKDKTERGEWIQQEMTAGLRQARTHWTPRRAALEFPKRAPKDSERNLTNCWFT